MKTFRFGIVGAGTALHAMYGPAFRYIRRASLVAACDPWEEARRRAGEFAGLETYPDLEAMLDQTRLDAVIVASPTWFHRDHVLRIASAGLHVFCEKPMARTLEECDEMIEACRAGGAALGVGFMKRFNPSFVLATDMIRSGRLGRIVQVSCEWNFPAGQDHGIYAHPHTPWRGRPENWGGIFQDHGSHTVDLCRQWLGEVRTVSAEMLAVEQGRAVEEAASVVLRHEGGGISQHNMNMRTHKPLMERCEIFGVKHTLEISWGGTWRWSAYTPEPMNVRLFTKGTECLDLTLRPEQSPDQQAARSGHYVRELEAFIDALEAGTPPPVGGTDARAAIEVICAAILSSHESRKVALPLQDTSRIGEIFASGGPRT